MNDLASLLALSYKTERAASRRLMATAGMTETEALHQTLTISAGRQGLAALLEARAALQQVARARADARAQARQRPAIDTSITPWRGWFDGSAHPNPGRCGIGALLLGPGGQRVEIARAAGYGNSSEAEYRALIALLDAAVTAQAHGLTIYGDSRVVIDDMQVQAAQSLLPLHTAAHALMAQLTDVRLRWIPRHKNGAADALSQRGSALQHETADEY